MKVLNLHLVAWISLFLMSCTENRERWEKRQIDDFGSKLAQILVEDEVEAYSKLWLTPDSVPLNIKTKQAVQVPFRTESLSEDRAAAIIDFKRVVEEIKQRLGSDSNISLNQIEYLIDRHPWKTKDGIFEFRVILQLERADKRVFVLQRACVMTTQGIRVGDSPVLVNKDGIEVPIRKE